MPKEITGQFSYLFLAFVAFLFSQGFFGSPLPSEQKCWQAILQIKSEGELYLTSGLADRLKFMAEAEWHGFLEEDGLDFIIYHLVSDLKKWELWTEKKSHRLKSSHLPRPDFQLDYVEGLEKEIRFYYSFRPSEITWPGENTAVSFKLLLPSAPRVFKKEEGPEEKIKTTGSRIVVIERKALENPVVEREFYWKAEVSERPLLQKKEVFSVWLKLFLKRLSS